MNGRKEGRPLWLPPNWLIYDSLKADFVSEHFFVILKLVIDTVHIHIISFYPIDHDVVVAQEWDASVSNPSELPVAA